MTPNFKRLEYGAWYLLLARHMRRSIRTFDMGCNASLAGFLQNQSTDFVGIYVRLIWSFEF